MKTTGRFRQGRLLGIAFITVFLADGAPDSYDAKSTAIYADGLKFKTRASETTVFDPRVRPSAEGRLDSPEVNESFLAYLDSLRGEFLAGESKPT